MLSNISKQGSLLGMGSGVAFCAGTSVAPVLATEKINERIPSCTPEHLSLIKRSSFLYLTESCRWTSHIASTLVLEHLDLLLNEWIYISTKYQGKESNQGSLSSQKNIEDQIKLC